MSSKRTSTRCLSIIFYLCIIACSLQGCKREAHQTNGGNASLSSGIKKGHKEAGFSLYENGENQEAIEELKQALADSPDDVEVYCKLASAYSDEEMTDDAISMYKKAVELEPNHIGAHYDLGLFLIDNGMCDEGIAELRKVWELNPRYEDVSFTLGDAYYDCKKVDDAIAIWESLLKEDPDDKILHYNLGIAYRDKRQLDRALSEAEKALAGDMRNADAKKLFRQLTAKKRSKGSGKSKKKIEKKNH